MVNPCIFLKNIHIMRTFLTLISALLFLNVLFAQNNAVKITNLETNEVILLQEGQRIRVITVEGRKHSGKLNILEDGSIIVHKTQLTLNQIEKMKPHPLGQTIITSFIFVYLGVGIAVSGLAIALFTDVPAIGYGTAIAGLGISYFGFTGVNFMKGYHIADGYSYQLVKI